MGQIAMIAAAMQAAGQFQQGQAAKQEAEFQSDLSKRNAAVQEMDALAIEQQTTFAQKRQAGEAERVKGRQKVALAKAGVLDSQLAEELTAEQAAELELDNLLIGFEGATKARRARSQADVDRAQAKILKQKGRNAQTASFIGAGSSLLKGFDK